MVNSQPDSHEEPFLDFGFTPDQQRLIDRVNSLVRERIAPRAAGYDAEFAAPLDDIADLHREGWLLANLDKRRGGLGFGLHGDDPLSFFLSTNIWLTAIHQPPTAFKSTTTH